jgi:hypothetical protein
MAAEQLAEFKQAFAASVVHRRLTAPTQLVGSQKSCKSSPKQNNGLCIFSEADGDADSCASANFLAPAMNWLRQALHCKAAREVMWLSSPCANFSCFRVQGSAQLDQPFRQRRHFSGGGAAR